MKHPLGITALLFWVLLGMMVIFSCTPTAEPQAPTNSPVFPSSTPTPTATIPDITPVYSYRVVNTYPHDREAHTQGLIFEDGVLYESTGLYGRSSLRRVDLQTGEVLDIHELPGDLFGEGIAIHGSRISQLTWKSQVGYVYDKDSFQLLQTFNYPTEGWGLTHDGERLIMSDGTSTLYFLDPVTYERLGWIDVIESPLSSYIPQLNELEYVKGEIYANVWQTDRIARIAPSTGQVVGWIDLQGLLTEEDQNGQVGILNGIAYDAENDRLFVTGKLWPKLFEIELIPVE